MKPMHRRTGRVLPLPLALMAGASGAHAKEPAGLRFDSPGVLDLSTRELPSTATARRIAPTTALPAAAGAEIAAAPALGEEEPLLPFVGVAARCQDLLDACVRRYEAASIGREAAEVSRNGKRLTIKPQTSTPVAFADWNLPASAKADGDGTKHVYAGRLDNSRYHRVEVQFDHDAPGSFLVNPGNGKTAFVHNGADVTATPRRQGVLCRLALLAALAVLNAQGTTAAAADQPYHRLIHG